MGKKFKSPQEKKTLSYEKDCQNVYGENDKGSRKAIPKRKALANRKIRKAAKKDLQDQVDGKEKSGRLERLKKNKWRKDPDRPLGENLDWRENIPVIGRNRDMKSDLRKEAVKRLRRKR